MVHDHLCFKVKAKTQAPFYIYLYTVIKDGVTFFLINHWDDANLVFSRKISHFTLFETFVCHYIWWNSVFYWFNFFWAFYSDIIFYIHSLATLLSTPASKISNQPFTWRQIQCISACRHGQSAEVQNEHQNGKERRFKWLWK